MASEGPAAIAAPDGLQPAAAIEGEEKQAPAKPENTSAVLKLKGLPYTTTEQQVRGSSSTVAAFPGLWLLALYSGSSWP